MTPSGGGRMKGSIKLARCASQYLLLFSSADALSSKVFLFRKRRRPARDIWVIKFRVFGVDRVRLSDCDEL